MTLKTELIDLLSQSTLTLSEDQIDNLISYVELLIKWNKAYNLTSVRDPSDMLVKHILDSLMIGPVLEGNTFIDVGTGPGLPGIPLAILYPERKFVLLDSLGKRITFLRQVIFKVELTNVVPILSRVENYVPENLFDGVLSRAFASLTDMVTWCDHLVDNIGSFYALKGVYPTEEIQNLPVKYTVESSHKIVVPELEGERHLIKIMKTGY